MIASRFLWMCCVLALSVTLHSCDSPVASASQSFSGNCWTMTDTLSVTFENSTPGSFWKVEFPTVFTDDYAYSNIWVTVEVMNPAGKSAPAQYNYVLMDEYGNWYGELSGGEITFRMPLGEGIRLDEKGTHTIRMYHYMRHHDLCGVASSGIEVRQKE